MQYNSLTRAIYVQYRSLFDRTPAAALALVLVVLTAIVLRTRVLRARARPVPLPLAEHGASAAAHPARWLALARSGLLRRRRRLRSSSRSP